MQTAAGTPTITDYGPYYHAGGVSQASLTYPYKYYAAYDTTKRATGQDIRSPGVNGGATLFYIDLFAWAARHERGHHKNWMRFWPQGIQGRTGDSDLGVGDYLPDVDEPTTLAPEGGPFLPTSLNSHANDGYDGQTADCERHNCNSIHAMPWNVGSANDHDWACPGSKYDQ